MPHTSLWSPIWTSNLAMKKQGVGGCGLYRRLKVWTLPQNHLPRCYRRTRRDKGDTAFCHLDAGVPINRKRQFQIVCEVGREMVTAQPTPPYASD